MYFALTLSISGLAKIDNPKYFKDTLTRQRLAPSWSIVPLAWVLPWLEVILAFILLIGVQPVSSAVLLVGLFLFFLVVKMVLFVRGYSRDCGCYGNARPQANDGLGIAIALIIALLALTYFWLVLRFPLVAVQWRLGGGILLLLGWSFLLGKTLQRRDKGPAPMISDNGGLSPGEQAPDFAGLDQQDQMISLETAHQGWLLLGFVSPGCSACPKLLKALYQASQEHPHVQILLISGAGHETNKKYADDQQIPFSLVTTSVQMLDLYQVHLFPFVFILDKEGIVRARGAANSYDLLKDLLAVTVWKANSDENLGELDSPIEMSS